MKIELSEINMKADNSYTFEQNHSSEFISHVINAKLDVKDTIDKQNYVKLETTKLEKVLLNNEKNLNHQNKIQKNILEVILSNFTNNKEFDFYPIDKDEQITKNEKLVKIEESKFTHIKEYHQKSSVEYNTQAHIQTNQGQINIDLDISFSQEFYEKHKTEINSKKTTYLDPLIINYKSDLTSFDNINSTMRFEFDLNSDGKNELIPELKDGAGFLALDKNGNKTIDNGNELFGANTGDGFKELREYDEDKNSWIDENDSIFDNLLIWENSEDGDNSLIGLGQAGIGAIYLSAVDSGFTYSTGIKDDYARLKQSSFHLKEDGKIGLITSVDFAII